MARFTTIKKVQKFIRGIRTVRLLNYIQHSELYRWIPALINDFNLEVDRLSQYVFTRSPNIDFIRGTQGRGGRNSSSVNGGGRGGGTGIGRLVYGQGEG